MRDKQSERKRIKAKTIHPTWSICCCVNNINSHIHTHFIVSSGWPLVLLGTLINTLTALTFQKFQSHGNGIRDHSIGLCLLLTVCVCVYDLFFFLFHFVDWLWLLALVLAASFPNGGGKMRQNSHGIRNKTIASGNLGLLLKLCVLEWMQNVYKYILLTHHTRCYVTKDNFQRRAREKSNHRICN